MSEFLYEMHAHTRETSRCAEAEAHELVEDCINAGYKGIVITDHMSPSTFERFKSRKTGFFLKDHNISWHEKVSFFLNGYHEALKAADGRINILLGMELRFNSPNSINDYLVYGVTEDFLYNTPDLLDMDLRSFSNLAHKNEMIVFQAHPFRVGMTITNPKYLNGIEVYNGNPRHNSHNMIAGIWAKEFNLLGLSGSDYHKREDASCGGVYFKKEITDNETLVHEILAKNYRLK